MKRLIRRLGNVLSAISLVMIININTAAAATRLTPYHLYLWAKNANVARLEEFKRYINIKDYVTQNTALCIAQQQKDYSAYKLLLQFGASVRVPCHDDSDLQCRKIIKETGGINTGLVLLGAAAVGAGALALGSGGGGGGSSGPSCNVADYPLDACPEHGICSTCENKLKLDSCERFWQKSGNTCVPAACPAGQYLKGGCPEKAGTSLTEVPSSSYSGNEQCYACQYTCNDAAGFHQDKNTCMNTYPGYSCKQHENGCFIIDVALDCPNGEATSCAERPGFTLTQTESGNLSGTLKCYRCTYAPIPCPDNQYTNGNCPQKPGNAVTQTESGSMSGADKCYYCSYTCDTKQGYYNDHGSCQSANPGKTCGMNAASGCYKAGGCDNAGGYYDTAAEINAKYPGYNAVLQNGCYVKGTPKSCPENQFVSGSCPPIDGKNVSQIATPNYSGDDRCYRCSYTCNTDGGWYDSMLNCTSANVGNTCAVQSNGCYRVSGCDVSKKYYDTNSACILANTNKSCARDERSGCYKVTGCDNSQGYYDTREEVTSQFPGYNIIESNGCFARGTAKTCPDGEYTSCAPKTGNTVVKNETGNYAGPSACGTCIYTCNTSLGYYKDNQTCTADNYGKTCSLDKASDCYKTSGCNTALGYYGTVTLCENAFKGYNCIADNGCYTKGTAKDCPVGEYLKGNCPKKEGTTVTEIVSGNMSGSASCYTCRYSCNPAEKHYDDIGACQAANTGKFCAEDGETGCFVPSGCNTAAGYYEEEGACLAASTGHLCAVDPASSCYVAAGCKEDEHYYDEQQSCEDYYVGYECTTQYGCYVKGGEKPCPSEPEQEYTECPSKEGNKVTPTPTENMSGAKQCYTCAYTCDETNKYYTLKDSCEKANPEQFCSLNDASGCYKPSGCNTAAGFYEEQKDCEAANTGYACELRDKCYVKGDAKDCPVGEYLTGKCPSKTGNDVSESPSGSMSGENQCFTCIYTCKVSDKYYPDNSSCQTANTGKACGVEEESGCYRVTGCDTSKGYYDDNGACTAANTGHVCNLDGPSNCYVKGACDTASKHYDDKPSCTAANTGMECELQPSTGCYIPSKCSTAAGYYEEQQDCEQVNTGYACDIQSNGCYKKGDAKDCPDEQYTECPTRPEHNVEPKPTGEFSGENQCYACVYSCNTSKNFYDTDESCQTANRGYNCTLTENRCYIKGEAKTCPLDEYTECPEKDGKVATPSATGNYAGELPCYSCSYGCDTSNNYYDDQSSCLKAHPGSTCAADETSGCHIPGTCNTAAGWYSSNDLCQAAFPGWNCRETGGCYTKNTEKACPEGQYTGGLCPTKPGNTTQENPSGSFAGDAACYTCAYTCDTKNRYYDSDSDCTQAHPTKVCEINDESSCYVPAGCDANKGHYDQQTACENNNNGYSCKLEEDCYVKGDPKACPSGEYLAGKCPPKDGNNVTEEESGSMSGEQKCYTCSYTCDTTQGYFQSEGACNIAFPEFTCVPDSMSGCYITSVCNLEDGYYEEEAPCLAANRGYSCKNTHGCYSRGDPLNCPSEPEQQYTECPPKTGNIATPTPSGSWSGDKQCNTCAYTCDTAGRYYEDMDACNLAQPEYICAADPASGCYKPSKCDAAQNFYDDQETCEEYYDGYACKTQNGCYVKGAPKQCPSGEYVTCPGKEGNIATPTPTDNKSGDEYCNTCAYACDTEHQYYTEKAECSEKHPSHYCEYGSSSGCYTPTGCDNSRGYYGSLAACTSTFKGYECVEEFGCYTKGAPKACPSGEYTAGLCPDRVGNDVEEKESGNFTGEEKCFACEYTCISAKGYYSDAEICENANTGRSCALDHSSQCFMVSGCRTDMGYYSGLEDCENAFKGYSCTLYNECYIKGDPKRCPTGQYTTGLCPEKPGTTVAEEESGDMSGENPCYNCVYTCKAAEGFYGNQSECTRNNPGKSCYVEETSGCYKAGDCDELNNYYNDSGSCEAANTGYFCKEDELSKCYVKGDARQCPQDEYTKGGCAEKPGNKLDEIASGNYAGEEACYRCSYSCLTDQGYYPNSGVCEDANKGYICETDPESGCFVKTDAAPCPENEYTSGKCPSKPGNTTQYVPTENMSGTNQCYTCEYQCDAEERYYPSDELCTTNNKGRTCSLDGLSQCYTPTGCDEKQGYYEDLSLCMQNNTGYACKSEDGCYVKDIALECPENEYVTCPEKEGNIATPTPTDNYAGEYRCNTCSYACNNDTGHYTEETECTAAHQGWLCAMDVPSGCYKTSTCDEANHFYNKQESCEEYYNGYSCTLSAGCYVKGGVKPCPSEPEQEYTECPVITGKKLVSSDPTGNMSGEQQCYTCQYECDVAASYYPDESSCNTAHTQKICSLESNGCYYPKTCNTEQNLYDSQSDCEKAFPGYYCKLDNECYVQGEVRNCPVGEYLSCEEKTGNTVEAKPTENFSGGQQCYTCTYSCDTENMYYEDNDACLIAQPEYICAEDSASGCFKRSQCDTSKGFYTKPRDCTNYNPGYECDYVQNGCTGKGTAKTCPAGQYLSGQCPQTPGMITTERSTGNFAGDAECYRCEYECGGSSTGYYPNSEGCEIVSPTGTCTQDAESKCYIIQGCDEAQNSYNTSILCEKANPGYTCKLENRCFVPDKDNAKACPEGEYVTCPEQTGKVATPTPTANQSGDNVCNTCTYACDTAKGYYSGENECPEGTICTADEASGCWRATATDLSSRLTLTNTREINITISAEESKDIYGIKNGANIKNTTDSVNGGIGRITISHFGTGTAYGMYGSSSGTVTNDTGASVAIKSYNGGDAVGIYSNIGGTVINKGSVAISGNAENAYGIYGEGQNTITNEGSIDVEGQNAYGIYVKDGQGTTVTNTETGTITVNSSPDGQAHGIFIDENSSDAVVNNFGTITVNGEVREGSSGITLNGAKLRNYSLMSFSGDADLDALGGKIYLEDGGVYEAESLKGDLAAGSSTVMGGNQDTYVQEGSLKTENADGLNLSSESALFKAEKKQNASGGYDVVLNRRNFNEFAQNASLGEYLEQNYKQGNLEGMYDDIKGASSDAGAALSIADKAGLNTLTNFADENFQVLRSLNRNMADTILKPSDEPYRVIAGYDNYNLETDNKSYLSGYDLSANSMYTFGDKRIDNKNRLGLGIGYTKISTSYDDGGDRDLNIVTVFMPWLHKFTDNLRLASVLSLGYGYGEYDRGSDRESDITDFFYGLTNELRYTVDLNGYAELEPALMLNALGYTEDGFDEGNGENDLVTKKTHNLSVEAGIGLFLKKEVKTEKYGKFAFKVGGVYYHEFASPFDDIKARHSSGSGWYYIRDDANLYQRDRAVLEAALDYEYKDIALYAKYNRLIQKNDPQLFDLGVKYKF